MRLILAVSCDGYLARGPEDDMSWTGQDDKRAFRLLTTLGGVCGASTTTLRMMPPTLSGRSLTPISRSPLHGTTLEAFAAFGDWLLGGPTLAVLALERGLVDEAVLVSTGAILHRGIDASALRHWLRGTETTTVPVGPQTAAVFHRIRRPRGT